VRILNLALACGLAALAFPQDTAPKAAVPLDPIETILDAFKAHALVALGEGPHGNEQGRAFRLALVRDPRFPTVVNDVMTDCGASRHQALMDRFVNGEDIPREQLKHVWQDTSLSTSACERPLYEEFFRAIRDVNVSLPKERRLRVLLGDAPGDWSLIKTRDQHHRWAKQSDAFSAEVILEESLAKGRRALLITGDGHLIGRGTKERLLINRIEQASRGGRAFVVTTSFHGILTEIQPNIASWKTPSMTMLKGTIVGARPFSAFYQPPPAPGWSHLRMEDEFDALLYLGPPSSMTRVPFPVELCRDEAYMKMRLGRMRFIPEVARKTMTDAFVQGCQARISQ
jgi:hypothetical protein